jgi:hypothetical protein
MDIYFLDDIFKKLEVKLDINNIIILLKNYKGDDWKQYSSTIEWYNEIYHKILIKKMKNYEVYLIYWNKNITSPIHDHPSEGCVFKVLEGELIEDLYFNKDNKITFNSRNILHKNEISYNSSNTILHNIINQDNKSISIHIYFPPDFIQKQYYI